MDKNTVFKKTEAGEGAVRQRTKIVQRNQRMALVLVDGKASVAEMLEKTGNPQLIEDALEQLFTAGYITPIAPGEVIDEMIPDDPGEGSLDFLNSPSVPPQKEVPVEEPAPMVVVMPTPAVDLSPPPPPAGEPTLRMDSPEPAVKPAAPVASGPAFSASTAPLPALPASKPAFDFGAMLSKLFPASAPGDLPPVQKGNPLTRWLVRIGGGLAATLIAVFLILLLYPYDGYRETLAARLKAASGKDVKVERITSSLSPYPNITVSGLRVGGDGAYFGTLRAVPQFGSLLSSRKTLRSLEIDGARFTTAGFASLAEWLNVFLGDAQGVVAQRIVLSRLSLELGAIVLNDLAGEVEIAPGGGWNKVRLQNADMSLRLDLSPGNEGWLGEVQVFGWDPGLVKGLKVTSGGGKLMLRANGVTIKDLSARMLEGVLEGEVGLPVSGAYAADMLVKHASAQVAMTYLLPGFKLSGEMNGKLRFFGASREEAPGFAGAFTVVRGQIDGLDLPEALRLTRGQVRGGTTRFEQLDFAFSRTGATTKLSDIVLSSGIFRAEGALLVEEDNKVNGVFEAEMRSSARPVRSPLRVSGDLGNQQVAPGR